MTREEILELIREHLKHYELIDMPDPGGYNNDHDKRYYPRQRDLDLGPQAVHFEHNTDPNAVEVNRVHLYVKDDDEVSQLQTMDDASNVFPVVQGDGSRRTTYSASEPTVARTGDLWVDVSNV